MSVILDVTDAGGLPIGGIVGNEVQVSEQGNAGTGVSISSAIEAGANLAVALTIDVSGSMVGAPIDRAKAAAIDFVNRLSAQDQASVVAFGNQVRQVQGFTSDKEALRRAISSLTAVGNTRLYDALYSSVDEAAKSSLRRKVVVLLSDGTTLWHKTPRRGNPRSSVVVFWSAWCSAASAGTLLTRPGHNPALRSNELGQA
jgi:Ca-activated chloride channel family protein